VENPFLINLQGKFETDTVMKLRLIIRRVMINGVAYELKILFQEIKEKYSDSPTAINIIAHLK
jgi:hypothetical protein